jgi:hypothetical protein
MIFLRFAAYHYARVLILLYHIIEIVHLVHNRQHVGLIRNQYQIRLWAESHTGAYVEFLCKLVVIFLRLDPRLDLLAHVYAIQHLEKFIVLTALMNSFGARFPLFDYAFS